MSTLTPLPVSQDWPFLAGFLPLGWEAAAESCSALRHGRVFGDPTVLLRVLLIHLADGCSLAETSVRAEALLGRSVSAPALFKRLRAAEEWLRWLADRLWRRREPKTVRFGGRVRVVDATVVAEDGGVRQWRMHWVINLADLRCDFFRLSDLKLGETFRNVPVLRGDLILGDRAYGTAGGVAHLRRQGAHPLARLNLGHLPLFDAAGKRLSILRHLRRVSAVAPREWPAWVHEGQERWPGRLIAIRRTPQSAAAARARVERRARRKAQTLSAATRESAGYVFVWTSLPATALDRREALELYRLRWQIELVFKRLKSILGLGALPKHSDASSRAWLYGKLLVALLLERLLEEADSFSPWGFPLDLAAEPLA